ncbi:MAG: signal peptidase I [Bacilli bacterium]|nr:signal peptidase I [Bacilli bacterium]
MKKTWLAIKDYVIIIVVVVLIRTFLVTPAIVDGASMDETLKDGQLVFINKIVYRLNDIKRYDIVVVKNEHDNDKIIKRVIGLPNETIKYQDNKLFINGELMDTSKFDVLVINDSRDFEITTGDDEYFVMGDNRPVSKDSRYLGNFKSSDIVGRVRFRLFPFTKFGIINK